MWHTVVVTGGCGFIGSNLVDALVEKNLATKIVVLDNYTSGTTENENKSDKVEYVKGDTCDILTLLGEVEPDIVFHFAEFSRIVTSFESVNYVFKSNAYGTQQVCEYCVSKKAKLVYSGSSSIFGNNEEDSNLSPYAFLKKQNIQLLKNYKSWFGLDYIICYFYNVYGPRNIEEGDYSTCIARFVKQYKHGDPLTVVAPGTQRRTFTHVSDIISGVLIAAHKGNSEGEGYKLCGEDELSIFELVKLFGENIKTVMLTERRGERFQSLCSESLARTELAWSPRVKLADYVRDFVDNVDKI